MPNLSVSIPHQLSKPEAKLRIEDLISQVQQQFGASVSRVEKSWDGDTLAFTVSASGVSLSGHAYIEENLVRVEVPVPWALAMFSGTIKQRIEQEGRRLLGPPEK
jgi:putative polyhydroxyalkanoate system protein